jgi:type VI secretion system protein ImpH
MAGPVGKTAHPVVNAQELAERPWAFDFFQALRRLEVAYREKPRFGTAARPADEPIRVGQDPSMAFAPAALSSYRAGAEARLPRLGVEFFGLFGPQGPLPLHLTEHARERAPDGTESAFARFADVFHHRLLLLFFRAWASSEPVVCRDRPGDDPFARYVASLAGLGLGSLRDRDVIADSFKFGFAGRFLMHSRNAEGLEAMLAADLNAPVEIEEFIGGWAHLSARDQWRLGEGRQAGRLGVNAFLGRKVWQVDQKFRLVIGPVDNALYHALLPGGSMLPRVIAIVRGYIGDQLDWDIRLLASREVREPVRLTKRFRLGFNSWLGPRPQILPVQDVVFDPLRSAAA